MNKNKIWWPNFCWRNSCIIEAISRSVTSSLLSGRGSESSYEVITPCLELDACETKAPEIFGKINYVQSQVKDKKIYVL